MLTADLAQSWQRGGRTGPRYIDAAEPGYRRDAAELIHLFGAHEGRTRRELETRLEEYVGVGTDYRTLRGLIKLLSDRCEFETACPVDPVEIRRSLFLKARVRHPVVAGNVRAEVVTEAARELGHPPEVVLGGLYADLPENQKLVSFELIGDGELLDLYNLAQAQALLYRCVEMRVWVEPQRPQDYRELFDAIKSYRLIHTVKGNAAAGYEVRLDGPLSMFHRSQKYGIQMAVFLPALLLCKGWRMRAEIAPRPGSASLYFELDAVSNRLRSHYSSAPPFKDSAPEKLVERWKRFESRWKLEPSGEVIDLGESAFIPDFVLKHDDGHRVYLEALGFWTPRHLHKRLKEFEHAGVKHFILAASDELRGSRDALVKVPPHTIIFKQSLDPALIARAADQLIAL